jgi:RNAse (barnase) inhibitor barstar
MNQDNQLILTVNNAKSKKQLLIQLFMQLGLGAEYPSQNWDSFWDVITDNQTYQQLGLKKLDKVVINHIKCRLDDKNLERYREIEIDSEVLIELIGI